MSHTLVSPTPYGHPTQSFLRPFTPKHIRTKLLPLVAIVFHVSSLVKVPSLLQNTPAAQVKPDPSMSLK